MAALSTSTADAAACEEHRHNRHHHHHHVPSIYLIDQRFALPQVTTCGLIPRLAALPSYHRRHHYDPSLLRDEPTPTPAAMPAKSPPQQPVPATPRVISPSPAPSSAAAATDARDATDGYFGPVTRSAARRISSRPLPSHSPPSATIGERGEDDTAHAASPSRASLSAIKENGVVQASSSSPSSSSDSQPPRRRGGLFTAKPDGSVGTPSATSTTARLARIDKKEMEEEAAAAGKSNGHLSPSSAATRSVSRSPSPLGLIPIHRHWRSVVRLLSLLFPPSPSPPPLFVGPNIS